MYPVTAEPPLDAGAVQDTTDWASAFDVAATPVGAPGVAAGTAAADGVEGVLVPAVLVAATVKV